MLFHAPLILGFPAPRPWTYPFSRRCSYGSKILQPSTQVQSASAGSTAGGDRDAHGIPCNLELASQTDDTIRNLDDVLGILEGALEAPAASEPPPQSSRPVNPEWAHLPPEELARREALLARRDALGERQRALQALCDRHARSLVFHRQQLALHQQQAAQLAAQRAALQEQVDPEAAAAWREAEAAREAKGRRDLVLRWVGLLALIAVVNGVALYLIFQPLALELATAHMLL